MVYNTAMSKSSAKKIIKDFWTFECVFMFKRLRNVGDVAPICASSCLKMQEFWYIKLLWYHTWADNLQAEIICLMCILHAMQLMTWCKEISFAYKTGNIFGQNIEFWLENLCITPLYFKNACIACSFICHNVKANKEIRESHYWKWSLV